MAPCRVSALCECVWLSERERESGTLHHLSCRSPSLLAIIHFSIVLLSLLLSLMTLFTAASLHPILADSLTPTSISLFSMALLL